MIATGSHTESIPEQKLEKIMNLWEDFVKDEGKVWADFHDFWTKSP